MPKLVLRLALSLLCVAMTAALAFPQAIPENKSAFTIFVGVKRGRLVVDRTKSANGFVATDEFRRALGAGLSEAEQNKRISAIITLLFDDLDAKFSRMQHVYEYALSADEQDHPPKDELTQRIRDFPADGSVGTWETFTAEFNRWVTAAPDRTDLKELFTDGGMLSQLNDISRQTALIFKASGRPRPFNSETGMLKFRVADPITRFDDEAQYKIDFPNEPDPVKAGEKRKLAIKLLSRLSGQLWRPDSIRESIEGFLAQRGLNGVVRISAAEKNPRTIQITVAARIARILFSSDVPAGSLDKIAYLLLPDRDFRAFVKSRPLKPIAGINGAVAYQALDYKDLGRTLGTEPMLNSFQFQIQQLELSQLGFTAFPQDAPNEIRDQTNGSVYVEIFVNKAEEEESGSKPANEPNPANPLPNEEGVIGAHPEREAARTDFVPKTPSLDTVGGTNGDEATTGGTTGGPGASPTPGATPSPSPSPTPSSTNFRPKDKLNYIGFGVSYKPGQKIRFFGIFQRERLLSATDDLSFKGGANEDILGALSYSADFVAFNRLHRRLSLQFSGNSPFIANRLLNGIETDERRTGGLARAELEIFRDRAQSLLRVYAEARHATVHLIQDDHIVFKQNLSTLDIGSLFLFEKTAVLRPKRFRFEPLLRIGVGLAHDEPTFVSFGATASYHQQLPHYLEVDLAAQFKFVSGNTPIYELASLGGAEKLRGFREDDALGRRMWTAQNELWMPLPGTSADAKGLGKFLRQQVRLAPFVDVGGIYGGTTDGVRVGPGLGARIIYSPAIIKLDWAYGIGDAASTGRGRGRFYFSVGTNLPF
jgi:surface antigen Omp85-like protein